MKLLLAFGLCGLSLTSAAQVQYANSKYGITFRYPRRYILTEGPLRNSGPGLGVLGPIPSEFVVPGGTRVVTLETPDGSYPGTDFTNAFFTVSINRYLTAKECHQFASDVGGDGTHPHKTISGIAFIGFERGGAAAGSQLFDAFYHGFRNGLCYELGYGVATAGYGNVDGMTRVNSDSVFSILETVFGTVRLSPLPSQISGSPSIRKLDVTPLPSPANAYQIAYEVQGAKPGQVRLSFTCDSETPLSELDPNAKPLDLPDKAEPGLDCNILGKPRAAKGQLYVIFGNTYKMTAKVRLFAAGRRPIAQSVTFTLPPKPSVRTISGQSH